MNFKILVVRMGFLLRVLSIKPQKISESPKERDVKNKRRDGQTVMKRSLP
jgi:hypothetical protein